MEMFPRPIPYAAGILLGDDVPVPHGGMAKYVKDESGRSWVLKSMANVGFQGILAEAIGWLLARRLEVPVPDAMLHVDTDGPAWMSELIPMVRHWDEASATSVVNPEGLGRMVALDAIIHNEDRHAGNILLQVVGSDGDLRAWSIDQGDALVGQPSDFPQVGTRSPNPVRNHARGFPVSAVADSALAAATVASTWKEAEIVEVVQEACQIVREPQAAAIGETLAVRCGSAPSIVAEYLDSLRSIE